MSELLHFLIRIAMKVLLFSLIPPQPTAPFEKEGCVLLGEQTTRRKGKKNQPCSLNPLREGGFTLPSEFLVEQMLFCQSIDSLKHSFSSV